MKILGIASSVNQHCFNHGILRAAHKHRLSMRSSFAIAELGKLPLYNPMCLGKPAPPPPPVLEFYNQVRDCDALLFASTEFPLSRTFGIQSPLKNALDWGTTAATGPEGPFVNIFYGKPAAIIGAGLRYGVGDINQDSALRRMCEWLEMDLIQAPPIALDLSDHRSLFDLQTTDVADPMMEGLIGKVLRKLTARAKAQRPYMCMYEPEPATVPEFRDGVMGSGGGGSGATCGVRLRPPYARSPTVKGDSISKRYMSCGGDGSSRRGGGSYYGYGGPLLFGAAPSTTTARVKIPRRPLTPTEREDDPDIPTSVTEAEAEAAYQWYQARIDELNCQAARIKKSDPKEEEVLNPFDEYGLFGIQQLEEQQPGAPNPAHPPMVLVSEGALADAAGASLTEPRESFQQQQRHRKEDGDERGRGEPWDYAFDQVIGPPRKDSTYPFVGTRRVPTVSNVALPNGTSSIDIGVDPILPGVATSVHPYEEETSVEPYPHTVESPTVPTVPVPAAAGTYEMMGLGGGIADSDGGGAAASYPYGAEQSAVQAGAEDGLAELYRRLKVLLYGRPRESETGRGTAAGVASAATSGGSPRFTSAAAGAAALDVDKVADLLGAECAHGRATPAKPITSPTKSETQAQTQVLAQALEHAQGAAPAPIPAPEGMSGWDSGPLYSYEPQPQYELRPQAQPPEIQRVYDGKETEADLWALCNLIEQLCKEKQQREKEQCKGKGPERATTASMAPSPVTVAGADTSSTGGRLNLELQTEPDDSDFRNSMSGGDLPSAYATQAGADGLPPPEVIWGAADTSNVAGRNPGDLASSFDLPSVNANPTTGTVSDAIMNESSGPAGRVDVGVISDDGRKVFVYTPMPPLAESDRYPATSDNLTVAQMDRGVESESEEEEDSWGEYSHLMTGTKKLGPLPAGGGAFRPSPPRMQYIPSCGTRDLAESASIGDDALAVTMPVAVGRHVNSVLVAPVAGASSSVSGEIKSESEKIQEFMLERARAVALEEAALHAADVPTPRGIRCSSLVEEDSTTAPAVTILCNGTAHKLAVRNSYGVSVHSADDDKSDVSSSPPRINIGVGHGGGFGYEYCSASRDSQDENGYYHGDEDTGCIVTDPAAPNYRSTGAG